MSISPVVMKGNEKGIRLIIARDASISQVKDELVKKLPTNGYYQTKRPISLSLEGKSLTKDEIEEIRKILQDTGLVIQIQNTNQSNGDRHFAVQSDKDGLFYVGNLKNGQVLETKESIIIAGNVEQGAAVYSEGSIIITGELKGYAQAGCKGRKDAFVYSYMSRRNL